MSFPVAFRKCLSAMTPYVPGKPVEELERELGVRGAVKLASNENPLGPSPKALQAAQEDLAKVHRYPDGSAHRLTHALASRLRQDPDRIFLGNGSNELLVRLGQIVLTPGDEVIFAEPSFSVYPSTVKLFEAIEVAVPLRGSTHDLPAFEKAITPRTRLVYIANPNNPTGTIVPLSEVVRFLEACPPTVLVVLDEAYYEYVDDPSYFDSLELLSRFPNLAVLRTFSKAYGLAGLRVGYGVAHPELAALYQKIRDPFNVNSVALSAAEAALGDLEHVKKVMDLNRKTRKRLWDGLREMGMDPVPSQANFIYFHSPEPAALYQALLREGVIIRPMGKNALRVTTGTEAETERFLVTLARVLPAAAGKTVP